MMSQSQTVLLGMIAGGTIFLGLPVGRLRVPRPDLRLFLNALAVGILLFILWDVLAAAWEPVDGALADLHDHAGGLAPVVGYAALMLGGLAVGLMSLVYYEGWLSARPARRPAGPGAMLAEGPVVRTPHPDGRSSARQLALLIAIGIGLHNFGEGLAIGQSASSGAIDLATMLIIGFALHNATEGFGIVAPLTTETERPSWAFLAVLGLIGGGPTAVGTLVGYQFTSDAMSVVFLSLAAGSILYVVIQLLGVAQRAGMRPAVYWGVLAGLAAGFLTDMVVTAGGV
jgi:ZIP family zinc transporter